MQAFSNLTLIAGANETLVIGISDIAYSSR